MIICAFCMVFHVRWIFLTTSLRIPPESLATRVRLRDKWWEIHLTWKTIQNAFSRILYALQVTFVMLNTCTLRKIEDHENHVRLIYLTTVLYMGKVRNMGETCHSPVHHPLWNLSLSTNLSRTILCFCVFDDVHLLRASPGMRHISGYWSMTYNVCSVWPTCNHT